MIAYKIISSNIQHLFYNEETIAAMSVNHVFDIPDYLVDFVVRQESFQSAEITSILNHWSLHSLIISPLSL